jgi:eukaryotic-like serine/threonine-protein kinase
MTPSAIPLETLQKILLGQLPSEELDRIVPQLETGDWMGKWAAQFESQDLFLDLIRTNGSAPTSPIDPSLAELIQKLKKLNETGSALNPDPTTAEDLEAIHGTAHVQKWSFLSPAQSPDEMGRLNGYRILSLLGEGGIGIVFVAEDLKLKRRVALKVMRPAIAAKEDHRQRFIREAEITAAVEHDHIIPIYQVGEEKDVPFIAMPLLKGESLEDRRKRLQPFPISEVIRIGRQIAEGLSAAHQQGLIHRDIKPANIWMESPNDRVRILDFGLARNQTIDIHLTKSGITIGTPAYMAPEQGRGSLVDHRSDLFSLGVILYQLSTGSRPFTGSDIMAVLSSLALDIPPAPNILNPRIPHLLNELILQLLEKNPADRPQTAQEVADRLRKLESNINTHVISAPLAIPVQLENPWEGIDDQTEPISNSQMKSLPNNSVSKRKRSRLDSTLIWVWIVCGALLLLLSGFIGYELMFKTPNGTLVVEIANKEVEARFKNGELKIYDKKGVLKYTLKPSEKNKTLPEGEYKIEVTGADGVKLDTSEFTMSNGKSVEVRVLLLQKQQPKPVPVDPERSAVEKLLEITGSGRIKMTLKSKAGSHEILKGTTLPKELFTIERIESYGMEKAHGNLEILRNLKGITQLLLINANLQDSDLENLKDLKTVTQLGLGHESDVGSLTNEGLIHLKDLTKIQVLVLVNQKKITEEGLKSLLKMTELKNLDLNNTSVGNEGIRTLQQLPNLEILGLRNSKMTDEGFAEMKTLKRLWVLHIGRTKITDTGLKHLSEISTLREFDVRDTQVTPKGIEAFIKANPGCRVFNDHGIIDPQTEKELNRNAATWVLSVGGKVVIQTEGKEQGIIDSKLLPSGAIEVKEIFLGSIPQLTDKELESFKGLASMRSLNVTKTNVSKEAITALAEKLPKCRIQSDHGTFEPKQ